MEDQEMRIRMGYLREKGASVGEVITELILPYREGLEGFIERLKGLDLEKQDFELVGDLFLCFQASALEVEDQLLLQWLAGNVFRYDCSAEDGLPILLLFLLEVYLKEHDRPFSMIEAFEFYLHEESYQELKVLLEGSVAYKVLEEEKTFITVDAPQQNGDQRHLIKLYLQLMSYCLWVK
jgi:hypothetical protein